MYLDWEVWLQVVRAYEERAAPPTSRRRRPTWCRRWQPGSPRSRAREARRDLPATPAPPPPCAPLSRIPGPAARGAGLAGRSLDPGIAGGESPCERFV